MRLAALCLLCSCAPWPPAGWRSWQTDCGMTLFQREGTWLEEADIRELEWRLTSALAVHEGDACAKLRGYVGHEQDGRMTELQPDYYVAGWTECWNRRFFYHRGKDDPSYRPKPWNTALWHEMVHAVQGCPFESTPEDDAQHPYWTPRGYYTLPQTMGYR